MLPLPSTRPMTRGPVVLVVTVVPSAALYPGTTRYRPSSERDKKPSVVAVPEATRPPTPVGMATDWTKRPAGGDFAGETAGPPVTGGRRRRGRRRRSAGRPTGRRRRRACIRRGRRRFRR